jgi:hypothetical protein
MLLELGFPEGAVEIVRLVDRDYSRKQYELLTKVSGTEKNPPMGADEYYYTMIKANPGALMVKLADINDNLQEWRLTYLPEETQIRLRKKYAKAKILLGQWVAGYSNSPKNLEELFGDTKHQRPRPGSLDEMLSKDPFP